MESGDCHSFYDTIFRAVNSNVITKGYRVRMEPFHVSSFIPGPGNYHNFIWLSICVADTTWIPVEQSNNMLLQVANIIDTNIVHL